MTIIADSDRIPLSKTRKKAQINLWVGFQRSSWLCLIHRYTLSIDEMHRWLYKLEWSLNIVKKVCVNTLRPRQNGCKFPEDFFQCIFLNKNIQISIKIPLKFVPKGPINNIPALIQIIAWHRLGDKSLSEQWWYSLLTHIFARPQWVNPLVLKDLEVILSLYFSNWILRLEILNTSCENSLSGMPQNLINNKPTNNKTLYQAISRANVHPDQFRYMTSLGPN